MSQLRFARVMGLILNAPLAAHPRAATTFFNALCGRFGSAPIEAFGSDHAALIDASQSDAGTRRKGPEMSGFVGRIVKAEGGDPWRSYEPFRATPNGTAIISVTGELVNRGEWVGADSGLTSYEGIGHQLDRFAANPQMKRAIIDIESPGGEAVGAFELADKVRKIAAIKPIHAIVNGMAASAGYAMISGATTITTNRTGVLGSIGVVMLHVDREEELAQAGIKPTLIFAGEHKVDGNPFGPLPDGVAADLQAEVDAFYATFLDTVSTGRGRVDGSKAQKLTRKGARDTQARTYIGADAVEIGLADAVGTFDDVLRDIESSSRKSSGSGSGSKRASRMDPELQAQIDKARAEGRTEGHAAGRAEGVTAGATEERDRLKAIIGHASVAGRQMAALSLALKAPGLAAEDVSATLDEMGVRSTASGDQSQNRPADPETARRELEARARGTGANEIRGGTTGAGPTGNRSDGDGLDEDVLRRGREAATQRTGRARSAA